MKTITSIKNEKPLYYVCINGENEFEDHSITKCKEFLCDFLKIAKQQHIDIDNTYDYYIGMYSISID